VDRGFDPQQATLGNAYNNSLGAQFELALISASKDEVYPLGTLESSGGGRYTVGYSNSALYRPDGVNKQNSREGFMQSRLWVNAEGKVIGRYGSGVKVFYPGIRPCLPGGAKPGDDLLLEFAIRERGMAEPCSYDDGGTPQETRALVQEGDYVAVYDKKLLWRANLSIGGGSRDWNDEHPWNAPQAAGMPGPVWWDSSWGLNDWNVPHPGYPGTAGGQVVNIAPWTRWSDSNTVFDGVAYGYGDWDSVFGFNEELREQRLLIEEGRDPEKARYQSKAYESLQWTFDSAAPGQNWDNYIFPARKKTGTVMDYTKSLSAQELSGTQQHPYYVNGSAASVPGLSTYMEEQTPSSLFEYNQTLRTSGVDCSGFVHRALLYSGSPYYAAQNASQKHGTAAFGENGNMVQELQNRKWRLEEKSDIEGRDRDRDLISRAVPGDILVHPGEHLVIIQDLSYSEGTAVITAYNQVTVIHATKGNYRETNWKVEQDHWGEIKNSGYEIYKLMRLK
jgi:hypothetical protein